MVAPVGLYTEVSLASSANPLNISRTGSKDISAFLAQFGEGQLDAANADALTSTLDPLNTNSEASLIEELQSRGLTTQLQQPLPLVTTAVTGTVNAERLTELTELLAAVAATTTEPPEALSAQVLVQAGFVGSGTIVDEFI